MKRSIVVMSILALLVVLTVLPATAEEPAAPPFTVARLVVATGIENRLPTGVADVFPASTEKLYCFLEAADIKADTEVVFAWFHDDQEVHHYALTVKQGPIWRTWAQCALRGRTGEWKAEVLVGDRPLQAVSFKVE